MVARFTGANVIDLDDAPSLRSALGIGSDDVVTIRPESIDLGDDGDVRGTVERVIREDATNRVTVSIEHTSVEAFAEQVPAVGGDVGLTFPEGEIHACRPAAPKV
jgi:hypothetical protein